MHFSQNYCAVCCFYSMKIVKFNRALHVVMTGLKCSTHLIEGQSMINASDRSHAKCMNTCTVKPLLQCKLHHQHSTHVLLSAILFLNINWWESKTTTHDNNRLVRLNAAFTCYRKLPTSGVGIMSVSCSSALSERTEITGDSLLTHLFLEEIL